MLGNCICTTCNCPCCSKAFQCNATIFIYKIKSPSRGLSFVSILSADMSFVRRNKQGNLQDTICWTFLQLKYRSGKSTYFLYLSRSTDTCVKKRRVKIEVLTQLLHSRKSNEVQVLKCTQNIKSFPLKNISSG